MSFISFEFLLFFAIAVPLYFAIPQRFRGWYLLVASVVFYASANVSYVFLLLAGTVIDYTIARAIVGADVATRRKNLLRLSIGINLAVLFFFKYFNFFNDSVAGLFDTLGIMYNVGALNLALPLGISFFTFAKIAYVIDVYRGTIEPEQRFGRFALFVGFFPNLTSGPIERAGHLIPQLDKPISFDTARVVTGLRRILWGAFKKVVIADRLAVYINNVYDQPGDHSGVVLLLATVFLAFQIYADFSGYTDMALGVAKVLGIDLFENFQQPYFATSILDFWRRWHMSLTSWIREFMFMPLSRGLLRRYQGRVSARVIQAVSYLVIMTLIGLWHGANWTFVIWGLLHGFYMGVEMLLPRRIRLMPKDVKPVERLARILVTFALVALAWVFFRANSVGDSVYIVTHIFNFTPTDLSTLAAPFIGLIDSGLALVIAIGLIGLLLVVDVLDSRWGLYPVWSKSPALVRWAAYYAATTAVLLSLVLATEVQTFIYFKF
jgi:alginate O-acetyltransferase complex protein AlgI